MKTITLLLFCGLLSSGYASTPLTPTTGIRLTYFYGTDIQANETCIDTSACGIATSTHPKKNSLLSIYDQAVPEITSKHVYRYINLGPCCGFSTDRSLWNTQTNGQQVVTWTPPGTSTTNFLSYLNVGEYYGKGSTSRSYTNGDPTYYNTKSITANTTALFEATNGSPNFRYIYRVTFNCTTKGFDTNGNLVTLVSPVPYGQVTSPAGQVTWDSANSRCIVDFMVTFGTPASLFTQNLVPSVSGNPYFTYEFYTITLLSVEPL